MNIVVCLQFRYPKEDKVDGGKFTPKAKRIIISGVELGSDRSKSRGFPARADGFVILPHGPFLKLTVLMSVCAVKINPLTLTVKSLSPK